MEANAMSYGDSIRRYVSQALEAATEQANQVELEAIENAARNVLRSVTVLQGISASLPVDCLDLYRDIPDAEPARLTVVLNEARAGACQIPLAQLQAQLGTLSMELFAVPGLERWGEVIGSLTIQADRVATELDVQRKGATEDRQVPGWVWGLVALFVLDRLTRLAR
jgi:hypothetical protein